MGSAGVSGKDNYASRDETTLEYIVRIDPRSQGVKKTVCGGTRGGSHSWQRGPDQQQALARGRGGKGRIWQRFKISA